MGPNKLCGVYQGQSHFQAGGPHCKKQNLQITVKRA
jgi:hypothetical protein